MAFKWLGIIGVLGIVGCGATRAIYGIPQTQWEQMNPTERQAVIAQFKKQEEVNARTRQQAQQAKQQARQTTRAEELAKQCQQAKEYLSDTSRCRVITRQKWGF